MNTPSFAFQHEGLDRAEHLRNQPHSLDNLWAHANVLVLNEKGEACCDSAEQIFYCGEYLLQRRPLQATFLGLLGEQGYFVVSLNAIKITSFITVNIRLAANSWSALHACFFAQAKALLHWQAQSVFCGRCGTLLDIKTAGYSAFCSACGLITYPQTHPAVIMCVNDGERVLLGRQAIWPEKKWSLLAGFVEPGESPEQTVVRETWEEAGVKIERVEYVISQPWPMPMALMLGYNAYAPYQLVTVSEELQAARWFSRTEIHTLVAGGEMELPDKISISYFLLQSWLANVNSPS
jgi:NAD+ diphosphatase